MAQITFVIPARNLDTLHRTLSMLSFQKDAALSAVIVDMAGSEAVHSVVPDFEHRFPVSVVTVEQAGLPLWKSCLDAAPEAEWVCFLLPGVEFNETTVKRMNRCIDGHDSYDAFRWNLAEPNPKWKLRTRPDRIFTRVFVDGEAAPLSSFVFRAKTLRDAFEADSEAAGMAHAVILTAAAKTGVRTARRERLGYTPKAPSTDPSVVEKEGEQAQPEFYVRFTRTEIQYGHMSAEGEFVNDRSDKITRLDMNIEGRFLIQAESTKAGKYTFKTSENDLGVMEYYTTWNEEEFADKYVGGSSISKCDQ